jgi:hypothetical protein
MQQRVTEERLIEVLQARTARAAIGASSMRRPGAPGVVKAARQYLQTLPLGQFGTNDATLFRRRLDSATTALQQRLPVGAKRWGRARKGVNIFLRDCLYTVYLRRAFNLEKAEAFFEIPLDSITGKKLCEADPSLPPWETVSGLTRAASGCYQEAAMRIADEMGIPRVHLDAIWWGERAEDAPQSLSPTRTRKG